MIRILLDANILFSAAYRDTSGIRRFRRLPEARHVITKDAPWPAKDLRVSMMLL
jgi:hypothetical protein